VALFYHQWVFFDVWLQTLRPYFFWNICSFSLSLARDHGYADTQWKLRKTRTHRIHMRKQPIETVTRVQDWMSPSPRSHEQTRSPPAVEKVKIDNLKSSKVYIKCSPCIYCMSFKILPSVFSCYFTTFYFQR
jgi:hypothetical protein